MSKTTRYFVGEESGNPVTDGVYETELTSDSYQSGTFVIAFYDAGGNAITPTGGTVKPEMSPIKGQWHEPSSGDVTIDATNVIAGVATYAMPVFVGDTERGRVTLSGITGTATTFKAYFWRT